jgi:hypothetical protein
MLKEDASRGGICFCCSAIISVMHTRTMRWGRWVRDTRKRKDGVEKYAFFFGNPEGKRLLVNHRCRLEDNIKM